MSFCEGSMDRHGMTLSAACMNTRSAPNGKRPSSGTFDSGSVDLRIPSLWHCSNQTLLLLLRILPNLLNLESTLVHKVFPLEPGALLCSKLSHHSHVKKRCFPWRSLLGQDCIVDQKVRVLRHSVFEMGDNFSCFVIRPVMENQPEVIFAGTYLIISISAVRIDVHEHTFDGLRREKVMSHGLDALESWQRTHFDLADDRCLILSNESSSENGVPLPELMKISAGIVGSLPS